MRSIRNQLLIYLVPGVLLLAAGVGVGLYTYMDEVLEHGLDAALAAKAQAIAGGVHMEDDGQPHLQLSDAAASAATRHEGPFYFQLWRADGRTLARVTPTPAALPLPASLPHGRLRPFFDQRLADGTAARMAVLWFVALPDEDAYDTPSHAASSPTPAPPTPPTPPGERLILLVAHDRRSIDGPLATLLSGLSLAAVVVAGGIVLVVTWGVRRALRPLDDVASAADRIGPDAMELRLPSGASLPAELRPIGLTLNHLLDRLAAGFARERRFSGAVAHELRTPLAELRTACEVALRWPEDRSATAAALTDSLGIAMEMGGMVENLLMLARGQSRGELPLAQAVCLATAVRTTWSKLASLAAGRSLAVEVAIEESVAVQADPDLLAAVLRNLLENAVEHSTAGGRIHIGATQSPAFGVSLKIGNSCEALTSADCSHVFEPFWRKSSARTGGTHAGLGLSIVQAYGRAMNVSISAGLPEPNWFETMLVFADGACRGGQLTEGRATAPPDRSEGSHI